MKKSMFTGWKDVFSFTFVQNTKTKSYKSSTISIAAFLFVIFAAINIITGLVMQDDESSKTNDIKLENVHVIDESNIDGINFENYKDVNIISENKNSDPLEVIKEINNNKKDDIVLRIYQSEDNKDNENIEYVFKIYLPDESSFSTKQAKKVVEDLADYFDEQKLAVSGIGADTLKIVNSDIRTSTSDIDSADDSLSEILVKLFVPMLVTLLIYMIVLMYGQSISKIIIVEKSSKLMETLLISVKPYAIILGKELGMYLIAISQIFIWIISAVAGFFVGDVIADSMFDKYSNQVIKIMNLIKDDAASAFTIPAVVIGIIALLVGFLMYCVLAGLISANITKAEELSNTNSLFQMIVVIGFLGAYFVPMMQMNNMLTTVVRYFPVTSAFMIPSDIIVGNVSITEGIISVGIMAVTSCILIFFTGKVYKKKVF